MGISFSYPFYQQDANFTFYSEASKSTYIFLINSQFNLEVKVIDNLNILHTASITFSDDHHITIRKDSGAGFIIGKEQRVIIKNIHYAQIKFYKKLILSKVYKNELDEKYNDIVKYLRVINLITNE